MHRLLVFDLDGTLAELGTGMKPAHIRMLQQLEADGYGIAICSGKPLYYLSGFTRQLSLRAPALIGETGAAVQIGLSLPPSESWIVPFSPRAAGELRFFRTLFAERFGDRIWFQPNEVVVSPFPKDPALFGAMQQLLTENQDRLTALSVYRQVDCFDLIPKDVNKASGVAFLAGKLGLTAKDVIAVGDGENDVPMLQFADLALGIGPAVRHAADRSFDGIEAVLQFLLSGHP